MNWSGLPDEGCIEPSSMMTATDSCSGLCNADSRTAPIASCGKARQNTSMRPAASVVIAGTDTASRAHGASTVPLGLCQVSVTAVLGRNPVPVTWVSMPCGMTAGLAMIRAQPTTRTDAEALIGRNACGSFTAVAGGRAVAVD